MLSDLVVVVVGVVVNSCSRLPHCSSAVGVLFFHEEEVEAWCCFYLVSLH